MASVRPQLHTTLRYVADLPLYEKEALYELHMDDGDVPPDTGRTNVEWHPYPGIRMRDMRAYPVDLGLDTTGFTWMSHTSRALPNFQTLDATKGLMAADQEMISAYIQETVDIIKRATAAETMIAWDWRYRAGTIEQAYARDPTEAIQSATAVDRMESVELATNVHLDISRSGASSRLASLLSKEERTKYSFPEWRIRMINVWRPLVPVVKNGPLALCDMRTVETKDILTVDKVFHHYINQTAYPKFNSKHAWYYLADQTINELLVFITYDSHR